MPSRFERWSVSYPLQPLQDVACRAVPQVADELQPLEFLKFTPKTNCGKCGYPACLAFAAAVTKGGEDPGKCPHVDVGLLGAEFARTDRGSGGMSGVAGLLDEKDLALVAYLKEKVRAVDFQAAAPRLGCQWSGGSGGALLFRYLGHDVVVSAAGMVFDGKEVDEPRDQVLVYNYIFFGGGEGLTGEWVGLESLPNSISKVRTLRVYCEERIAGHFCGNVSWLQGAAGRIDAVLLAAEEHSCAFVCRVTVLPRLPMKLLFWDEEREEGFPARVKVLFDRQALTVVDMESLVFAAERMAERLVELCE